MARRVGWRSQPWKGLKGAYLGKAHLDYIDLTTNGGADWDRLMKPLHEAAETYTQESSFIHEWAEARYMAEDASLEILTMRAYEIVRGLCQGAGRAHGAAHEAARVQGHDEGGVQVDHVRQSTKDKTANKAIIVGFGQSVDAFSEDKKVAVLDQFRQPATAATEKDKTVH